MIPAKVGKICGESGSRKCGSRRGEGCGKSCYEETWDSSIFAHLDEHILFSRSESCWIHSLYKWLLLLKNMNYFYQFYSKADLHLCNVSCIFVENSDKKKVVLS